LIFIFKGLKHLYIILLFLCPLVLPIQVKAQIYSTAEAALRSTRHKSNTLIYSTPPTTTFRSTSSYYLPNQSSANSTFSTSSIQFANGSIQTSASSLTGGVLADDTDFISTGNSQTTGNSWNDDEDGWGTGTPDLPLHLDWDSFLLLLLLAATYAYKQYARIIKRKATKIVQVIRKKG
jgi:hypothetical protein